MANPKEVYGREDIQDPTTTGPAGIESLKNYTPISKEQVALEEMYGLASSPTDKSVGMREDIYNRRAQRFDKRITLESELDNIDEFRARTQSGFSKVLNGISKGVVLAGTTFISGTVGSLVGLGQGVFNMIDGDEDTNFWQGLWDNEVNKAMHVVNKEIENVFINNYSKDELENPMKLRNIFSANFIGDKFLKNIGFTVGAYYSGAAFTKLLNVTKLPKVIAGITRAVSGSNRAAVTAAKMFTGGAGAVASAFNEGAIEAVNNSEEWAAAQRERVALEHEEKLKELEVFSNQENYADIIERENKAFEATLAQIEKERAVMGNTNMLLNLPILLASNLFQFGKLYMNGFKTARHLAKVKPTKAGGIAKGIMNGFSEGFEEVSQDAVSDAAGFRSEQSLVNFYNKKLDPNAQQESTNIINFIGKGFIETLGSDNTAEEFLIGSLTGFLGMPTFGKANNANAYIGKNKMFGLTGGLIGDIREANEEIARYEEITKRVEDFFANKKDKKALYQGLIRHIALQNDMNNALQNNNERDYRTAEYDQLISDIMAFDNANRLDDLKQFFEEVFDTSDANLDAIVANTTTTAEDGKKAGPFININGSSMNSTADGKQQMIDRLNKNKKDILDTINKYEKAKNELDVVTNEALSDDELEILLSAQLKMDNWGDRITSMHKEISPKLSSIIEKAQEQFDENGNLKENSPFKGTSKVVIKTLKSIAGLDINSKSLKFGIDLMKINPSFNTIGMINQMLDADTTMNSIEFKQFMQKFGDIIALSAGKLGIESQFNNYVNNTDKLKQDLENATIEAERTEADRAISGAITALQNDPSISIDEIVSQLSFQMDEQTIIDKLEEASKDDEAMQKKLQWHKDKKIINGLIEAKKSDESIKGLLNGLEPLMHDKDINSIDDYLRALEQLIDGINDQKVKDAFNDLKASIEKIKKDAEKLSRKQDKSKENKGNKGKKGNKSTSSSSNENKSDDEEDTDPDSVGDNYTTQEEKKKYLDEVYKNAREAIGKFSSPKTSDAEKKAAKDWLEGFIEANIDKYEEVFGEEETEKLLDLIYSALNQNNIVAGEVESEDNITKSEHTSDAADVDYSEMTSKEEDSEDKKKLAAEKRAERDEVNGIPITKFSINRGIEHVAEPYNPESDSYGELIQNVFTEYSTYSFWEEGKLGAYLTRKNPVKVYYLGIDTGKDSYSTLLAIEDPGKENLGVSNYKTVEFNGKKYIVIGALKNTQSEDRKIIYGKYSPQNADAISDASGKFRINLNDGFTFIKRIYSGRFVKDNDEKSVSNVEGYSADIINKDFFFGIKLGIDLITPLSGGKKSSDVVDINGYSSSSRKGSLWILSRGSDGKLYPKAVRIKFTNEIDWESGDEYIKEIKETIKKALTSRKIKDRLKAKTKLLQMINFNDIVFSVQSKYVQIGADKFSKDDYSSNEEYVNQVIDYIASNKFRFQVSKKHINDAQTMHKIASSGIITTNISSLSHINGSFDVYKPGEKVQKSVNIGHTSTKDFDSNANRGVTISINKVAYQVETSNGKIVKITKKGVEVTGEEYEQVRIKFHFNSGILTPTFNNNGYKHYEVQGSDGKTYYFNNMGSSSIITFESEKDFKEAKAKFEASEREKEVARQKAAANQALRDLGLIEVKNNGSSKESSENTEEATPSNTNSSDNLNLSDFGFDEGETTTPDEYYSKEGTSEETGDVKPTILDKDIDTTPQANSENTTGTTANNTNTDSKTNTDTNESVDGAFSDLDKLFGKTEEDVEPDDFEKETQTGNTTEAKAETPVETKAKHGKSIQQAVLSFARKKNASKQSTSGVAASQFKIEEINNKLRGVNVKTFGSIKEIEALLESKGMNINTYTDIDKLCDALAKINNCG